MADCGNSKDWPTLNDSNIACASALKSKQGDNSKNLPKSNDSSNVSSSTRRKEVSNVKADVTDGAAGLDNPSASTNAKTGARRKKPNGKTKWSPVPIDLLSYKDNRNERHYNESHRFVGNGRRFNNHESANNIANGHENSKTRSFRGGRGGRGQFRSRRENAANSDSRRHQRVSQEIASVSHVAGAECLNEAVSFSDAIQEQVMRQIEYYFSEKNLVGDTYLRCHMDEQGYAHLTLIADFPRIKRLTSDLQVILEAVKKSSHLEVSDDVKVRPVIDPLRWPLKETGEASAVNIGESYADLMTAQFYNMSLDVALYHHIAAPKSHLPGELPWQYLPVDDQDKNGSVFCMVNDIYPQVDTNGLCVSAGNSNISNGHVSPSEHLNSPNSSLPDELASQFVPNDFEIKNGPAVCPVTEMPSHIDSNGTNSAADDSNIPNGQACSDHISSLQTNLNSEHVSQISDLHRKNSVPFYPVNGIRPQVDSEAISASASDLNIPNGLACSSDLRQMSDLNAYNCYYGQMSNGVLMYNSGGHYYVAPSNEILADSIESSDDKSMFHNKSPEPSR